MRGLLESVFGFSAFRANQEEVCRAAIAGRDLLLVMPAGSGKSPCFQLPAVARGPAIQVRCAQAACSLCSGGTAESAAGARL